MGRGCRGCQVGEQGEVAGCGLDQAGLDLSLLQAGQVDRAAACQWRPQGGDGEVEGQRGVQDGHAGHGGIRVAGAVEVGGQGVVFDDDALGAAGRAGGVDHVRGMACRPGATALLIRDCRDGVPRVPLHGYRLGQGQGGSGVVEHVGDAFGGVVRVDGQVGRAGLEHGQHADHRVQRLGQGDRDEVLCPEAFSQQVPGELVGAPVQFGVGQGGAVAHHRHGVRRQPGLLADQFVQRCPGKLGRGPVPLHQDPLPYGRVEGVQVGHGTVRVGDQCFQDPQHPVRQ
ncbi:hypothetical protein B0E38_07466 [Streptomyces sp. 111WW2]|nr:hypothetical protein B0E38_07466 [Streptomyces sp. 111WW2]